jgi:dipeptidyl aminopeptidase/acylaminoacyl peptidase
MWSVTAWVIIALVGLLATACAPIEAANVIGYEIEKRLGAFPPPPPPENGGAITGRVVDPAGSPVADAVALVATRTGAPFTATTDADGRYTIDNVPPGQYVPAFVAPGYEEAALRDSLAIPRLLTVVAHETTAAPDVVLQPHRPQPLPSPLPQAVNLQQFAEYPAEATFPPDSRALGHAYTFTHAGVEIDNLRLYLPPEEAGPDPLPLLFMIYPTATDAWQEVSVAYAAQGYAFVAVSPVAAHGLDIDAHAQDARVAFELAVGGHLHPRIDGSRVIALGGSFSSAILHRFLRDETERVQAWVNVGGVSNAFTGAAEFYRGELAMPPEFELAIPALGPAHIYPLPYLRLSPVYTASHLPPTFIVHTAADRIFTIDQAYQLEAALRVAGVPVETHYYDDDSHYLMIGEDITPASMEVYDRILAYIKLKLDQAMRPFDRAQFAS